MALQDEPLKTDWEAVDGVSTSDLNRIEGSVQSLQNTKLENISGVVDVSDPQTSTNKDARLRFASDASILWDESEDKFILDKPISIPDFTDLGFQLAPGSASTGTHTFSAADEFWTVPRGIYFLHFYTTSVDTVIDIAGASRIRINALTQNIFVSDGSSVRIRSNEAGTIFYRKMY